MRSTHTHTHNAYSHTHLRHSAYPIPHKKDNINVGHNVQIQGCAGKSVHLRGSCLRENCLRGREAHTVVIPVCLHYVRFKADVPCLQHRQITAAAPLKIFVEKGPNNIHVNQSRQCVVMMWVREWVIRCQHWMVAVKWAFCVVCLWAIKCQLFVPLLSGGNHTDVRLRMNRFRRERNSESGFADIIQMGQWGCCRTVLTFHYW